MSLRKPEEYIVKRRFRKFGAHFNCLWPMYASCLVAIILGVSSMSPWNADIELDVTNAQIECSDSLLIKTDMHFTLPNMDSYKTVIGFSECSDAMYGLAGKEIRIVDSDSMWGVVEIQAGGEVIYDSRGWVASLVVQIVLWSFVFILRFYIMIKDLYFY
jgi:hypothetical protein